MSAWWLSHATLCTDAGWYGNAPQVGWPGREPPTLNILALMFPILLHTPPPPPPPNTVGTGERAGGSGGHGRRTGLDRGRGAPAKPVQQHSPTRRGTQYPIWGTLPLTSVMLGCGMHTNSFYTSSPSCLLSLTSSRQAMWYARVGSSRAQSIPLRLHHKPSQPLRECTAQVLHFIILRKCSSYTVVGFLLAAAIRRASRLKF